MSYCNVGDQPKVTYTPNGGSPITFQCNTAPVNVSVGSTEPPTTTSNYNANGYRMVFNCSAYGVFNEIVNDWYQTTIPNPDILYGGTVQSIFVLLCGSYRFAGTGVLNSTPAFDYTQYCPAGNGQQGCTITVTDTNGNTLFSTTGQCPITYTVQCGTCPDGQCQCESNSYPGYCCQDCGTIASQIANITQQVRAKGNG